MKFTTYKEALQCAKVETARTGIKHKAVKTFYYSLADGSKVNCWTIVI